MAPKLVASDLDGTLLTSDGTVTERTRRAIAAAEAAGTTVVFCTARPPRWLRPLAEATGHRGVAICANGAMLWDLHTESALETSPLDPSIAKEVVARLQDELPGGAWAMERAQSFGHEPAYVPRWPVPEDTTVDAVHALITEPAVKLLLRTRHFHGHGVAVANAHPEVIAAADEVTASNDESGVALVLERFF